MLTKQLTPLPVDPATGLSGGFERPTNGCFDKNGKFVGVPEEGKEVLTGEVIALAHQEGDNAPVATKSGAMHAPTES